MRVPSASRRLLWRMAAGFWALKIFLLSTAGFRSSVSGSFLSRLFRSLGLDSSSVLFSLAHLLLRKGAHLAEYAALLVILYRVLLPTIEVEWDGRTAGRALALSSLYAFSDEIHQLFVPGRGASFLDCAVDLCGSTIGLCLIYWLCASTNRNLRPAQPGRPHPQS